MKGKLPMLLEVEAITFDDFYTLRYPVKENEEDIIYPILKALRKKLKIREEEFLEEYFRVDKNYRMGVKESLRECLLDDLILNALASLGQKPNAIRETVKSAVAEGLATRKTKWYPDAEETLRRLRKKGYKLGLISNTHWRLLPDRRKELEGYFEVVTLSYEHGYVKPHPSIFLVTLTKLNVSPNQCLHVGDDPIADIQGARQVGMKTAFIKRRDEKAFADIQINQIGELIQLL
jgi:HAD superfamily hydrolase (TIGR01549 family)